MVVGFLSHQVKVETGGESTNCHLHADAEVDWAHLSHQGFRAGDQQCRHRRDHTTHAACSQVDDGDATSFGRSPDEGTDQRLAVYDFEHIGVIGTERATLWEVHPITRIEVQKNGQWVDLDQ